ncbi:MAG TPA: efflux RND transporter periplasmic adaptor subunit [Fluviicoccus sp.]|nr:efflux RND transporter periplasmic adaptor subunit [Fluviicoccus sp.]
MDIYRHQITPSSLVWVATLALAGCSQETATDPRSGAPTVRSALVQTAAPETRAFTGTVAARVQSDLGFRVPGKVLARSVDAGQKVKRGQLLMRLDPADFTLAVAAQEEAVAAAKARAQQATADEVRYRELQGTGATSASAYDQVKAAADAANAQLKAAKAQLDAMRNANRYADLVADADGVVIETLAEPGQVVSAGQPVVRLAQAGDREAVVQLPETLRPAIGSLGRATLYGRDDISTTARLRQLAGSAERLTRTFEARYVLEGQLAQAALGTTVTIHLQDASKPQESRLQVPLTSLYDGGQGPGVWIVTGAPAKVSWRPVTIRQLDDDNASVSGQLRQGDRIVALGAHLLHEGDVVRIAGHLAGELGHE